LLPLILATGAWRLVTLLLCGVSIAALIYAAGRRLVFAKLVPAAIAVGLAIFCLAAEGPTAAWRHSPIGAGRADQIGVPRNQLIDWLHYQRRILKWEADGVESSVGLTSDMGYAFVVNGKIDGHSRFDAGTQVMSGLLGAMLHPDPRAALVVGLGTGSTAGWLGKVQTMERVDVVELEPATIHIAEVCAPVNQDVLKNPKVHLRIGDGREVLLTTRQTYDIIASEPSNPYRAGIASLYTTAFYRAVARKLRPGGLFLQWMQAYEIDSQTLRTVYATYHQTFPYVETWETQWGDLLLIGSFQPIDYDANRLRARIAQEPFRSALIDVWRVIDLEGVLAHYIAGTKTADLLAAGSGVNTDDRLLIEFAFARTLGTAGRLDLNDVRTVSKVRNDDLPSITAGGIDLTAVERRRLAMIVTAGGLPFAHPYLTPELLARGDASVGYMKGNYGQVIGAWTSQHTGPQDPVENLTFAEAEADAGSETALPFIENVRRTNTIEADVLLARLRWKQGRIEEATSLLERAFVAYRTDPWPLKIVMDRATEFATAMAGQDATGNIARRLDRVFAEPFSVTLLDQKRLETRALLAEAMEPGQRCGAATLQALHAFEPHVPWRREFLARRADCYAQTSDRLAAQAASDLRQFVSAEPVPLRDVVLKR
ncbi:MAG TPA: spermidine synthase, partial [Thermoanaerobaculia bacterium]|nr:spermidine synthase [Thermoanaerobaculia bacterium]